jgi:hypothetical protein
MADFGALDIRSPTSPADYPSAFSCSPKYHHADEVLILQAALHDFYINVQHALLIWLGLIGVTVAGFALMSFVARRGRLVPPSRKALTMSAVRELNLGSVSLKDDETAVIKTPEPVKKPVLAKKELQVKRIVASPEDDARRFAEEVAVAAQRAAQTAERRHDEWVAVQRTQDAAWRAYEEADKVVQRTEEANSFPSFEEPGELTADELLDRRRYLHRAATEAHARGELSAQQLSDALFHRNGWDPTKHPFEQQLILKQVARERLLRAYQEASTIERAAWHAYDLASAARRSLEDEAFQADLKAKQPQPVVKPIPAQRTKARGAVKSRRTRVPSAA